MEFQRPLCLLHSHGVVPVLQPQGESSLQLSISYLLAVPSFLRKYQMGPKSGTHLVSHPQLGLGYSCSGTKKSSTLCTFRALGRKRPLFTWESPPGASSSFHDPISPGDSLLCLFISSQITHNCEKEQDDFSVPSVRKQSLPSVRKENPLNAITVTGLEAWAHEREHVGMCRCFGRGPEGNTALG